MRGSRRPKAAAAKMPRSPRSAPNGPGRSAGCLTATPYQHDRNDHDRADRSERQQVAEADDDAGEDPEEALDPAIPRPAEAGVLDLVGGRLLLGLRGVTFGKAHLDRRLRDLIAEVAELPDGRIDLFLDRAHAAREGDDLRDGVGVAEQAAQDVAFGSQDLQ